MKKIIVNDSFQQGYEYYLLELEGRNFDPEFKPELTPAEMLELGVFGGKYLNDCKKEFPKHWFQNAKLSNSKKDIQLNFFQVNASLPLKKWQEKTKHFINETSE